MPCPARGGGLLYGRPRTSSVSALEASPTSYHHASARSASAAPPHGTRRPVEPPRSTRPAPATDPRSHPESPPTPTATPPKGRPNPVRPRSQPRRPVSHQQPCVRFTVELRPPSTDFPTFFRPQPGDREVVPSCVHRDPGGWASSQLRGLWIRGRTISTGCGQTLCPHPVRNVVHGSAHRLGAVVPSGSQLLHITVHCSATPRARSLRRVKAVTRNCQQSLWETTPNLGTHLGRTSPVLWAACAELSVLHREAELSTGSAHRVSG